MFVNHYVIEKLTALEAERAGRLQHRDLPPPAPLRSSRVLRAVGRVLRRTGAGLEAWAGPTPGAVPSERFPDPKYY